MCNFCLINKDEADVSAIFRGRVDDNGSFVQENGSGDMVAMLPSASDPTEGIQGTYPMWSTITYAFEGPITYNLGSTTLSTIAWSSSRKQDFRDALAEFEKVTNINFVETNNVAAADFVEHLATDAELSSVFGGGIAGYHESRAEIETYGEAWGFYNANLWTVASGNLGGFMGSTIMHELGHGMGLGHTHDTGFGSKVMDGVTSSFGDYGRANLNQGVYTVMSYNDGFTEQNGTLSSTAGFGANTGLGALDIAALQNMYGANTSTATGNNPYTLTGENKNGVGYEAIWDAGGIDEIVYTGPRAATINLNDATLTYAAGGGGFISSVDGRMEGFTIAAGVVIENATTGNGADFVTGNDVANTINTNGGNDTVWGAGGIDIIDSGSGHDKVYGGDEGDTILAGGDNDIVYGEDGADIISDGAGNDFASGGLGADTFNVGEGYDKIDGGDDVDQAVFNGNLADFTIGSAGLWGTVTDNVGSLGTTRHQNIESLVFNDQTIAAPAPAGNVANDSDFDRDGDDDMILVGPNNRVVTVDFDAGVRGESTLLYSSLNSSWTILSVGDFDNDGDRDLLMQHSSTGRVIVTGIEDSARTTNTEVFSGLSTDWRTDAVGDFDNDGDDDFLLVNNSSNRVVTVEIENSGRVTNHLQYTALNSAWDVAAADDFDNDGDADILMHNLSSGRMVITEMTGHARLANTVLFETLSTAWKVKGTGDFDGDGDADVLIVNSNSGRFLGVEIENNLKVATHVIQESLSTSWDIVGVGDYDGDGDDDILLNHGTSNRTVYYEIDDFARLGSVEVYSALNSAWTFDGLA